MKRTNLLKLLCLTIGLVMLVSALPISATAPIEGDTVTAPSPTVSEGHIDAVIRDFGTVGQAPNTSAHNTDAVTFTYSTNARVKADGTNNVLGVADGVTKTGLTINDLKGDSSMNGFVFSADYKFGSDYITGVADGSDISSCVQLLEFQTGYQKIVRLGHDGRIFVTLSTNPVVIPGVKISADQWFNFKVEMIPQSANKFTYYIYVDDVLVYTADLTKTASQTAMSYRVLAEDKVVGNTCMIDNVKFRTLPFIPDPDRVDTTIDFENIPDDEFFKAASGYYVNAENLGPYLNTSNTAVHTSWEGETTMNSYIPKLSSDTAHNRVWQNASSKAHFAVEDVNKRLVARDFTVSADMMFTLFPTDKTPLIQWLRGTATLSGSKINEFLYIDANGNFCQNGVELGVKTELNKWFNVTLRVTYVSHGLYNVATYIDGKLASVNDMTVASTNYATDKSFIRFFSTGNAKFTACLDNIQIYESDNIKITEEKDVIWNLNFNGLADNTQASLETLKNLSNGYEAVRSNMGTTAVVSGERLKISATLNKWIDVKLGKGTDDPVKEGTVSISFKFNLESETTSATASHRIIGIRRASSIPENSNGKVMEVVNLKNNALYFFGTKVMSSIELNKDYDIKVVLDGRKNIASLYIDGDKIVDSLSIANAAATTLGEGLSFVTDDAGNKHFLPYTGFVYQQKYDANGEAIADTYVKRFVQSVGYSVDMLRLFQTAIAEPTGLVYYVDDIKVERMEADTSIYSTDFTGWSNLTDCNPQATNSTAYGQISFADNPVIATESGNEYLHMEGVGRMFINDRRHDALYKSMEFSFKMRYTQLEAPSKTGNTNLIQMYLKNVEGNDPAAYVGAPSKSILFIGGDEKGNIYSKNGTNIGENISGKWLDVKILLISDGTKWTQLDYYVDGKFVGTEAIDVGGCADYTIRILPNNICHLDIDDISYKTFTPSTETYDFNLDFDGDYETMLNIMGSEFRYPVIGSTRTDAAGNTVTSSQVLGTDDKYLRIDRTLLAATQQGYIQIENPKYIGEKEYVVETDFRFNCDAGFGITPLTIITEKSTGQFIPVEVKGAVNTLNVNVRGAHYDLYNSAGTLLTVKTTEDKGFTKLAILVNENAGTYTVYVNERIAYYYYDGEYLPCANLPIIYSETGLNTAAPSALVLMKTSERLHNYSIIDIDRVAVIPAPSGIASTYRADQSRIDTATNSFDLRFIAGVDSLYGNLVGFKVVATYTDGTQKTVNKELTSNTVFSSIVNDEETILAEDLGSNYLFVMSLTKLPVTVGGVDLEITPFVEHGGVRSLGETKILNATCDGTTVTIK